MISKSTNGWSVMCAAGGLILAAGLALACTDTTGTAPTYTVGGTVSGLVGSGLVLRDNDGDDLPVSANGPVVFATPLASGAAYSVTVLAQPSSPAQVCVVTTGSGTMPSANVTTVAIVCATTTYTVGGMVSGLTGSGLVLRNNGGDDLPVFADGSFTFATALASGTAYSVSALTQPTSPAQNCVVTDGSGTVSNGNVTTVAIVCTTNTLVFASVSVGAYHSCGVTTSGAAYCWGNNQEGGLGDGTTANSATPVAVAGGLNFTAVSAGWLYTCGVTTASALYCWGSDPWSRPGAASPMPAAPGLTFASVSAGSSYMCGVTTTGTAYCWGAGGSGELGSWGSGAAVMGGLTFVAVHAGEGSITCGVTTTGAAYCWGDNLFGELGTGSTTAPEQCTEVEVTPHFTYPCTHSPVAVAGGLTFAQVVDGRDYACGLTSSGSAYCWGSNWIGQLGNGTTTGPDVCWRSNPCTASPVSVAGGLTFASVSAGPFHMCGLTTTGAGYCWGGPSLGDSTTTSSATPVAVVGGLTFAAVSVGGDMSGRSNTCGVTIGGAAYCWGDNQYGQLGDGTTTSSTVPVKVAGQP